MIDPDTMKKDFYMVGKKLILKGIANASIYLSMDLPPEYSIFSMFMGGRNTLDNIQLPLELWEKGWNFYTEPDFLEEEGDDDEVELQNKLNTAIHNEEFEKAKNLKERLEKIKKEKKKD